MFNLVILLLASVAYASAGLYSGIGSYGSYGGYGGYGGYGYGGYGLGHGGYGVAVPAAYSPTVTYLQSPLATSYSNSYKVALAPAATKIAVAPAVTKVAYAAPAVTKIAYSTPVVGYSKGYYPYALGHGYGGYAYGGGYDHGAGYGYPGYASYVH